MQPIQRRRSITMAYRFRPGFPLVSIDEVRSSLMSPSPPVVFGESELLHSPVSPQQIKLGCSQPTISNTCTRFDYVFYFNCLLLVTQSRATIVVTPW
jgi:hypothetical protein